MNDRYQITFEPHRDMPSLNILDPTLNGSQLYMQLFTRPGGEWDMEKIYELRCRFIEDHGLDPSLYNVRLEASTEQEKIQGFSVYLKCN